MVDHLVVMMGRLLVESMVEMKGGTMVVKMVA